LRGILTRGVGGFYYALDGDGNVQTVRAQGKLRRERLKPKVGDIVDVTPGNDDEHGWILSIEPRRNELTRPPVSNIDVIVIVVAAATPDPDLMLCDRLIMTARRSGIAVQLVVNKADLDTARAEEILSQYAGADVDPIAVSALEPHSLIALKERLRGKVHALAGQSGAGKSTLINGLYGLTMETGGLSQKIERGKNTTRRCELVPVQGGGMVLDTPGFSLLETDVFDPVELKDSWPEFAPYEGKCFFAPCYHDREPRCEVLDAVAGGAIDAGRHARYREILSQLRQEWRDRYD